MNEIIFQQDTAERKYWFKSASFAHPAKMVLGLQLYLIEHYTKKGDTILDPMTGSGTVLVACAIGRNVICIELEEKFVKMQQDNWEKIQRLGPMLGYAMGQATIIQGDSRNLDGVLADCAIFSPPYSNEHSSGLSEKTIREAEKIHKRKYTRHSFTGGEDYGSSNNNISNLPYGSISAVISSPPYEGSMSGKELEESEKLVERKSGKEKWGKHLRLGQSQLTKYSDKVDVVCTSPPYEESTTFQDFNFMDKTAKDQKERREKGLIKGHSFTVEARQRAMKKAAGGAIQDKENIGNLKSDSYLEAMLLVYQGCHRVLKPEGLLILVTKNFIRDKKIIRLDSDTIKLCEQAGFALIERLKRKLTQMSFWQRIYMQKFPDAPKVEFEDVLVFRKRTFRC